MLIDLLTLAALFLVPLLLLALRAWIKSVIEKSTQHKLDVELEKVRSELRAREEKVNSTLRNSEHEIALFREKVLTGRFEREAAVNRRMIEAVDQLWLAFTDLSPLAAVTGLMSRVNFKEAARATPNVPQLRQMFTVFTQHIPDVSQLAGKGRAQRPFISPAAWAYFRAYQTIVFGAYIEAKALETGIEDAGKYLNDDYGKEMLKAALPHQSSIIDEHGRAAYYFLLEELEEKLLKELKKMLDGTELDEKSLRQAQVILQAVRKADDERAKLEARAFEPKQ